MDKQEFISSGVLESYVLGTASSEEIKQIREMEKLYPEITTEIEAVEASLMRYAEGAADAPSADLKNKIEQQLFTQAESRKKQTPVVNMIPRRDSSKALRYAVAASVGLLLGVSAFTFTLYDKLNKTQADLSEIRAENDILADQMGKQEELISQKSTELAVIMKPGTKMVTLKGMEMSPSSSAMIVWNPGDKEVYIHSAALPVPPEGKQYQLWAMVDGKPVDAGVFTFTSEGFVMQKMKDMPNAQAFAITLENAGGSPVPTMDALFVMGNV